MTIHWIAAFRALGVSFGIIAIIVMLYVTAQDLLPKKKKP